MSEEKYKVKFRDHQGNWRYTKSFKDKESAELAKLVAETTFLLILKIISPSYQAVAEIIEVCPNCESENINTNGGDCYCVECNHKWSY